MSNTITADLLRFNVNLPEKPTDDEYVRAVETMAALTDAQWDSLAKETQLWVNVGSDELDEAETSDEANITHPDDFSIYDQVLSPDDIDIGDHIGLISKEKDYLGTVVEITSAYIVLNSDKGAHLSFSVKNVSGIKFAKFEESLKSKKTGIKEPNTKAVKKGDSPKTKPTAPEVLESTDTDRPDATVPEKAKVMKGKTPFRNKTSASYRIRQLIVESPTLTMDAIRDTISKEGFNLSARSLDITFKDTHQTLKALTEAGKL